MSMSNPKGEVKSREKSANSPMGVSSPRDRKSRNVENILEIVRLFYFNIEL